MAVLAGGMVQALLDRYGPRIWAFFGMLIVFQLGATFDAASRTPPGFTTQFDPVTQIDHSHLDDLIAFLDAHGEKRGYTNYWVSYPLAFLSSESLIFTPRLPYHTDFRYTERDNRYDPYNPLVEESDRVSYITTFHPDLDARLREGFTDLGVTWMEAVIGDYQIFYQLSRPVRPEELGLGVSTP